MQPANCGGQICNLVVTSGDGAAIYLLPLWSGHFPRNRQKIRLGGILPKSDNGPSYYPAARRETYCEAGECDNRENVR